MVSRVTGGQGAVAAAAAAEERGLESSERDRLEAEAPQSRVGAGRSPRCHLPGARLGHAAQRWHWPGESLPRNGTSREERTWGCSVLGSGGRAGRGLLVGRGLAPRGAARGPHLYSWILVEDRGLSLAVKLQDQDQAGGHTATGARRQPVGPCSEMRWESVPQRRRAGARGVVLRGDSASSGAHFPGLQRCFQCLHSEWVCVPLVVCA